MFVYEKYDHIHDQTPTLLRYMYLWSSKIVMLVHNIVLKNVGLQLLDTVHQGRSKQP